ncbi:cyclophilin-like fold protein [Leeuwenhoekiella sp. NPDC079379]|uniref:cyclophilin-like fold protein n=1 Tax=Leeuwenhoekiella sp. NPDC079379 TaxID=3364122 RepID=UPI0037CA9BAC
MKFLFLMLLLCIPIFISGTSYWNNQNTPIKTENKSTMSNQTIKITVDSKTFNATLLDNPSSEAFKELLPMSITMTELNDNEKYYDLPKKLPSQASNPGTIHNGDLMLYGSNTLVLFYKTFSTSYSYTKLGSINDPAGFKEALGTGNVIVKIEL